VVEPTGCPLNVKCTLPCPPNAMCAQPAVPDVLLLTDADNGRTVTVATGTRVSVQLASTYWTFDPPGNQTVLVALGTQSNAPCAQKTVPGSGCGTATITYAAEASGSAVIAAHRTSCGEAMPCNSSQSSFGVTVVVS
jgi:hypothetical protein